MIFRMQMLESKTSKQPRISVDIDVSRALDVVERIISDNMTMEAKR